MSSIALWWGAVGLLALAGWLAAQRARQLRKRAVCRREFFAAACDIVDDERAPDDVAAMVADFSASLDSRRLLRRFLLDLLSGRMRRVFAEPPVAAQRLFAELQAMPSPLRRTMARAMINFALATTYNNAILGTFVRRVIFIAATRASGDGTTGDGIKALVTDMLYHSPRGQAA